MLQLELLHLCLQLGRIRFVLFIQILDLRSVLLHLLGIFECLVAERPQDTRDENGDEDNRENRAELFVVAKKPNQGIHYLEVWSLGIYIILLGFKLE